MDSFQASEEREVPALHPLTPEYNGAHHSVYFEAIRDALAWTGEKTVRNIALTGSYGVGKSSILRQVANDGDMKSIQVSLSTLGFERPATAADGPSGDSESANLESLRDTPTNQIQKEIVKQLLYTQRPEKMPGSRYRRTSAFNWRREVFLSVAASIPLAVAVFLLGWTARLASLLTVPTDWAIASNAGMAVLLAALVTGVRFSTHNKLRIDSVSTGAATITLSSRSDTYFDEYLDEIVYFFQVVDTDIVIFEDIDRFEDPHIFETLRELNTILNAAKQLNGRAIRFIYAIKDSIFEELGIRAAKEFDSPADVEKVTTDKAVLEVARANRTKFFDLVIPVVPFVTHQTARDLMSGELDNLAHDVSDNLIDLVAKHVADMRLIKNIRNEFVIFHEQVIRKSSLDLSDDHLLAMVLYKSTHLSDFERIKLGTSNLDTLYRESRSIVQKNITRLRTEITRLQIRLRDVSDQAARASEVGDAVDAYINLIAGHAGLNIQDVRYAGASIPRSDLRTQAFWQRYTQGTADLSFVYRDPWGGGRASNLTKEELQRATGETLEPSEWESASRADLERSSQAAREDLAFFSKADMKELMTRADVTLTVKTAKGEAVVGFANYATTLLGSKLATELVSEGFVDRYFTLYTSTFPGGRVNANAMNFILKNVDVDSMDFFFTLSSAEAKAVLGERPRIAVSGKSVYNLDLVNYLVTEEMTSTATKSVLSRLQRYGDDEKQFLQAFLTSERDVQTLSREMARAWPNVLVSLVEDMELDDTLRASLVDSALHGLMPRVDYLVSEPVAAYLSEHYAHLSAFTATGAKPAAIALILKTGHVEIPDLAVLTERVRAAVVAAEQFSVTRANLLAAISPSKELSLDALRKTKPAVYNRAVRSPGAYLEALDESEASVVDFGTFASVLADIDKADRKSLPAVVGKSVAECRVAKLTEVTPGAWPALAVNNRFPPTFANVTSYIEQWGIDANLAVALATRSIEVQPGTDEDEKRQLALELMNSRTSIPSADQRAALIESLGLASKLDLDAVPQESGEWIGRLIEHNVLGDTVGSFGLIKSDDWGGLEFAIGISSELPSFIDSDILPPELIPQFLDSAAVPQSLKKSVAGRFEEFSEGADRGVIHRMAHYVVEQNVTIKWTAVVRIAQSGAGSSVALSLVRRFDDSVTIEHLRPILTALRGDYPQLLDRNGTHPRFSNTPENVALLQRMQRLGTVKTFSESGSYLKANMRRLSA